MFRTQQAMGRGPTDGLRAVTLVRETARNAPVSVKHAHGAPGCAPIKHDSVVGAEAAFGVETP